MPSGRGLARFLLVSSRVRTSLALPYGRGAGVGRDRGVGIGLGVAVAVAVGVAVAVAVAVGVAVGVGVGVPPVSMSGFVYRSNWCNVLSGFVLSTPRALRRVVISRRAHKKICVVVLGDRLVCVH